MKMNGNSSNKLALPLSDFQLQYLISRSNQYSQWLEENRLTYPDPDTLASLTGEQLRQLGFDDGFDYQLDILSARKKKKRKTSRKAKSKSGKPRLPDPDFVCSKVDLYLDQFPEAQDKGNLIMGSWNMEFLTSSKVDYFHESYKRVIARHHVLFLTEVAPDGVARLAELTGYQGFSSRENNRNQAVGFLVHPRLSIVSGPNNIDSVAEVMGIPNLRPAFELNVLDQFTMKQHCFVVTHNKSMRGGPKATSKIRYRQNRAIASALEGKENVVIGGDFNTFLNTSGDTAPLAEANLSLILPDEDGPTHIMGGRLDGFFERSKETVGAYKVRNFWRLLRRDLSDHGCITAEVLFCDESEEDEKPCFDPTSKDDPFSKIFDGECEVNVG